MKSKNSIYVLLVVFMLAMIVMLYNTAIAEDYSSYQKRLYPNYSSVILTTGVSRYYMQYKGNKVNFVHVNRAFNNALDIRPVLTDYAKLNKYQTINNFALKNDDYFIIINGGYFNPKNGLPLGVLMVDYKLLTGNVYNRATLGIWDNKFDISKLSINSELTSKKRVIKIDNFNIPRMLSTHTLVYTNIFSDISPKTPKYGMQITVRDDKIINKSEHQRTIPKNGYVVIGPKIKLDNLKIGDPININHCFSPNWNRVRHLIGGGPILIENGKIVKSYEEKLQGIDGKFNRTAVGITEDNSLIIMVAVGNGLTLYEEALLMQKLKCVKAMNLDGGSSTNLMIKNGPRYFSGRSISNILIVK